MTAGFDLNLVKADANHRTDQRWKTRMQLLNAFNRANFYILSATADARTASVNSSSFGQTRAAYRDSTVSGTNDPGGRLIEFQFQTQFLIPVSRRFTLTESAPDRNHIRGAFLWASGSD